MNSHFFKEEATGLVFSCEIYECEVCGDDTAAPETLEETTEEEALADGLKKVESGLDEGVETAFGYMCMGCLEKV